MTNFIKKLIAAVTVAGTVMVTPAHAATTIVNDYGGSLVEYIQNYNDLKASEGKLRLDGFCISACTLFLGIVPVERTCATENSFFGFHSAYIPTPFGGVHSAEATRLLGQLYPKKVVERLKAEGFDVRAGDAHPELIYIDATDLMPKCSDAPLAH